MSTIDTRKGVDLNNGTDVREVRLLDATCMPEMRELGICATCDHNTTCLFLKASRQPVWFCDEFTDKSGAAPKGPATMPAPQVSDITYSEAQSIGLCSNCETRKECMHRKPGEQVMECEDYS